MHFEKMKKYDKEKITKLIDEFINGYFLFQKSFTEHKDIEDKCLSSFVISTASTIFLSSLKRFYYSSDMQYDGMLNFYDELVADMKKSFIKSIKKYKDTKH
jgi:uridine kinase